MRNVTFPRSLRASFFPVISCVFVLAGAHLSFAGSATWDLSPTNSDWNTAANWTPLTMPNAPTDTAAFGASNLTNISLSAPTEVATTFFNPDAAAFTISLGTQQLTLSGAGVVNNSAVAQTFVVGVVTGSSSAYMNFKGSAAAGNAFFHVLGSNVPGSGPGNVYFNDNSSAGDAVLFAEGGSASGGGIGFSGDATAGNATLTAEAALASGVFGGIINFGANSSMGHATITAKGGAVPGVAGGFIGTVFGGKGGDATVIAEARGVAGAGGGRINMNTGAAAENCTQCTATALSTMDCWNLTPTPPRTMRGSSCTADTSTCRRCSTPT